MTRLTVYDPPMCCSSGVCGPDVDQRLVDFAADIDWLKAQGADVRRFGLSREPEEFAANPTIRALLQASGGDDLPAIMLGDALVSKARYPSRAELAAWAGLSAPSAPRAASACCAGASGPATAASGCCGGASDPAPEKSGCC